jgi:hypothetical protein
MATRNTWHPPARTLRQMGWLMAGGLALAGHLIGPTPAALFLQLYGAAIFAVSTVRPRTMTGLYWLVMWLASPLLKLFGRNVSSPRSSGEVNDALRRPRRVRPRNRPATS